MSRKPLIAISMGDPAGIGPEIIVKALCNKSVRAQLDPIIIGNAQAIERTVKQLNKNNKVIALNELPVKSIGTTHLPVLDLPNKKISIKPGKWSSQTGQQSYQAVALAIELAQKKQVQALVTAPICKAAWQAAGINYPGHTELLAKSCHQKEYAMMFVGGPFRLILATIHQPLAKVSKLLSQEKIEKLLRLGAKELKQRFGITNPRIAVAGLNPHAGEGGLFGREEINIIGPAIKKLNHQSKLNITGPYPPDTLFAKALQEQYDLIMCMYHDQGLIPFKMLALHQGVNVTAGLPIIRTSPDHGTAFEIAGKNQAHPGSMIAALKTAVSMIKYSNSYLGT